MFLKSLAWSKSARKCDLVVQYSRQLTKSILFFIIESLFFFFLTERKRCCIRRPTSVLIVALVTIVAPAASFALLRVAFTCMVAVLLLISLLDFGIALI